MKAKLFGVLILFVSSAFADSLSCEKILSSFDTKKSLFYNDWDVPKSYEADINYFLTSLAGDGGWANSVKVQTELEGGIVGHWTTKGGGVTKLLVPAKFAETPIMQAGLQMGRAINQAGLIRQTFMVTVDVYSLKDFQGLRAQQTSVAAAYDHLLDAAIAEGLINDPEVRQGLNALRKRLQKFINLGLRYQTPGFGMSNSGILDLIGTAAMRTGYYLSPRGPELNQLLRNIDEKLGR